MRILQLTNRIPYPPKDGGAIAMINMTKGFHALRQELHLLSLNTNKHYADVKSLPPLFSDIASFGKSDINTDVTAWGAFKNLFSSESYHITRFYSEAFDDKLIKKLKSRPFDVVQLEGLSLCLYIDTIRRYSRATMSLRAHNVEHLIWERLAAAERNPMKRAYLSLLARRLRNYELEVIRQMDALVTITEKDAEIFRKMGYKKSIHVSPAGLDLEKYNPDRTRMEWPSVFHLGSLDWMPNQQGLQWFLREVWPKVHAAFPEVIFYIAGRNMPDWIRNTSQPGVKAVGEVEDAAAFLNSKAIMVVPLHSGSGMRIKIIEGMAMAKTIISTSIGVEGIEVENGREILIADTADDFAEAIKRCLSDRSFTETLGINARKLAETRYDNIRITAQLLAFYKSLSGKREQEGPLDQIFE
jgi:glycosyltransferase involved in cell wall biosynthesis